MLIDVGEAVSQVAAGWYHTCVVSETDQIRCFGEGNHGRLGYGNTDDLGYSPETISSLNGNVPVFEEIPAGEAQ